MYEGGREWIRKTTPIMNIDEGGRTTYGTACLPYHRASRRITNSQNSVPEEDNRWLRLR